MATSWMVRAGEGSYLFEEFKSNNCVAIGWSELGDISDVSTKEAIRELLAAKYSDWKTRRIAGSASIVWNFLSKMKLGDMVVTYSQETRQYLVGEISGDYSFVSKIDGYPHVRKVKWTGEVSRDALSVDSRNSLGAIQAFFEINKEVSGEISALLKGVKPKTQPNEESADLDRIREDTVARSFEFIKDRILELDWEDAQELVAGILRAMGYKTRVSPKGPDLGKDIVASPDGLGLEQPRIRVEVKHRPRQQIGAPDIRSFIGALRAGDKGLYVSTGGFSTEARYEAERATIPITLVDLNELVKLLIQHYESSDLSTRALVPLVRMYWPTT